MGVYKGPYIYIYIHIFFRVFKGQARRLIRIWGAGCGVDDSEIIVHAST